MFSIRMLRSLFVTVLVACATLVSAAPPPAQEEPAAGQTLEQYIKIMRGELTARRDSALQAVMQLDATEAKKFKPLKDGYDAELKKLADRRIELTKEFAKVNEKLTPEKALEFSKAFFTLEDERNTLRRKTFDKMAAEVSPIVAVQFMQLQRQFELMADLKAATLTPLALK